MKLLTYISLCFLIISYSLCEEVEIIILSDSFTIDTIQPEIDLYSPSHGDIYSPFDVVELSWSASDQSPASNPMTLNVSANLDDPYVVLFTGFPNTGYLELDVPDHINTIFASVRLDITDYFGNTSYAYSSGYFTLGNPNQDIYNVVQEDAYTESVSSTFEIDTQDPVVSWIFPNESTSFDALQGQVVRWDAQDESMSDNPIDLLFVDGGVDTYILEENIVNSGIKFTHLPDIITSLGHFKVIATDYYGNTGYDLSDEYMSVGEELTIEIEEESITDTLTSASFTIDTKVPEFNMITDSSYFYPSGGEILSQYNDIALNWDCMDDSYENMKVVVSMAYLLGGWYTVIDTFPHQNFYGVPSDLSFDGVIDNSIWGRLIFEAIDGYGNSTQQYNDDYFILGSSDGDIGAELYDEDNLEMFISWTWENKKHRVAISPRAVASLNVGDQIDIIDENGIVDNDCSTENGIISLGSATVNNSEIGNFVPPIHLNLGVNHCSVGAAGGGKMPGYVEGDSIRIRVTTTETSYFLRPSEYRGSLVFNNKNTIIKEFNSNEYQIENINIDPYMAIDEREIDNFNVYSRVTNHGGGLNREVTCDNDGVCDASEAISEYTIEADCTSNGYEWDSDSSVCYFDHNSSGDYSPDEVDENIADCYSDCCSVPGDDDWCFVEMVSDEEFNHSLVHSNYVPANTSTATVSYKVYALDENLNEVYEAVSEDAEISLGSSDISSIPLTSGWNWISFNRDIENMTINSVFSQFLEDDWQCDYGSAETNCPAYIKSQDGYGIYYDGYGFHPNFTMDVNSFYKLQMNADSQLWYGGSMIDPASNPISLNDGWNWIGYLSSGPLSINTALAGIIANNSPSYAKSQSGYGIFYDDFGFHPDITMDVNGGYMLQMETSDILTYPSDALYSSNFYSTYSNYNPVWSFNYRDYEFSSTATLEIDMEHVEITQDDQIAVFNEDICLGTAKAQICPVNDRLQFSLMFYNNEEEVSDLTLKYYNAVNDEIYNIRETINFVSDENFGDAFNPILLHDNTLPEEFKLNNPYPNPFNPITTINFELPKSVDKFILSIYDIRGRLVENLHNGSMTYGYHSYKWNADNYSSGIYFINMITEKHRFTKKITLLK